MYVWIPFLILVPHRLKLKCEGHEVPHGLATKSMKLCKKGF